MIDFIIWLVASFIATLSYTYLYYKLNSFKFIFKWRLFIVFLLGVIFLTLLKYYNISFISKISYFLFYPILFAVIGQTNFKKLIYYLFVVWLCGIILDYSSMVIISLLYTLFKIDIYSSLFIISMSLYVFAMFWLISKSKRINKSFKNFYNLVNKINYSNFIILVFTIFIFVVGLVLSLNMTKISVGVMACLVAILTIFIFALLLRSKYNELENSIFINTLRKNNAFYLTVDNEQNIFKHNLIAKLLSVESVANKKARELLQDLIKEFNSNIDYSQKIKDIPYGLDGVINEKIYPYNDKIDIKIDNKIEIDIFDVLKPRRYNVLVEKLSLLLDNALEACVKSYDKILVINLYEENNQICIEIKNTFGGIMNVDEIGKVNYSTKGNKHGFGLYSIFRNNEVSLNVKVVNNMFVARVSASKNIIVD